MMEKRSEMAKEETERVSKRVKSMQKGIQKVPMLNSYGKASKNS